MTLNVKANAEVRDDCLRVIKNGLIARGVATPNVGYGSDYYITSQAVGNEIEAASAGIVIAADDLMPDTATGESLDRWLANVKLSRRPPGQSSGSITFSTTAATLVTTGSELIDPSGARFTVDVGGTYDNGRKIAVTSVATGKGTNLLAGTMLRWVSPPTFAASASPLDSLGTFGGVDQEDDETARSRLLDRLGNPPNGDNWSAFTGYAESGDVEIQKAYCYPAANGPSTCHVAVVGYATSSTTRSRVVSAAGLANATSAVVAGAGEFTETVITAVVDVQTDLAFLLTLPEAVTANPAGTGGGWIDGAPWPSVTGITTQVCDVVAVTSSTVFRVNSAVGPVDGETIHWVDKSTLKLYTAIVSSSSEITPVSLPTPGVYEITIDTPFVGVATGDYISPGLVNAQTYLDAVLEQFALLGPGEKTAVAGLLPRAYRRPRNFDSWPYTLGPQFLKALVDAGDEVLDSGWAYQNGGTITPALPTTITAAPKIFVPYRLGFYHE